MEKRYAARGSFSAEHLPVGTKSSNLAAEIKTTDAMPRLIFILFSLLVCLSSTAQEQADSLFRVHLENDEYQVWMDLNLYDNDIVAGESFIVVVQLECEIGISRIQCNGYPVFPAFIASSRLSCLLKTLSLLLTSI